MLTPGTPGILSACTACIHDLGVRESGTHSACIEAVHRSRIPGYQLQTIALFKTQADCMIQILIEASVFYNAVHALSLTIRLWVECSA